MTEDLFLAVGGIEYRSTMDFSWRVGGPRVDHVITIPAGFVFQSSVPRGLWWFMSPHDPRFLLAAFVHDWLLQQGYGRTQAAAEWHDAARKGGAPYHLARRYYVAVAWWAVYKNNFYVKGGSVEV